MTYNKQPTTNDGFTLIEIMTAVSIFLIIMTISMGSIIGIFDANRKSKSLKTVMNNLNLAVETMSREMRFGKNYHCSSQGNDTTPRNCINGDTYISFLSSDGEQITYQLANQRLEKKVDNEAFVAITAPEIVIESLEFFVLGAQTESPINQHPKVHIKIKGYSGTKSNTRSDFTLQTLVSQRYLDT